MKPTEANSRSESVPRCVGGAFAPLTNHQVAVLDASVAQHTKVVVVDEPDDAFAVPPLRARLDWVRWALALRSPTVDERVSSVPTFDELARRFSLNSFVPIPVNREIREDVTSHFSEFPSIVRKALTLRVCCVVAESTGKTTLVSALAKRYRSVGVGEFGRDYTVMKKNAGTNDSWTTEDFINIAKEQQRLEDDVAQQADAVMFCDTDAMSTDLWHERYLGTRNPEVGRIAAARRYDLFVLCDIDIPWQADEIRLGANTRTAMHQRFLDVLAMRPEAMIVVSGSIEQRMGQVDESLQRLLNNATMAAHERWSDIDGNYYAR